MACTSVFTIGDGTTTATITTGALADDWTISKQEIAEGHELLRFADGSGKRVQRFSKRSITLTGAGPGEPTNLSALSLTVASWTLTFPGFADGSGSEVWTVVPARPTHTRSRRGNAGHSWTITLEEA
jgi:hypothetical protein